MIRTRWRNKAAQMEDLDSTIRRIAHPLRDPADLDPLLDRIGDARYVLLGEASHGTAEYYEWRTHISKRLVQEKGFSFIAVEGDWPDCYRVNRYVKVAHSAGESAREALHAFSRWPTWMWANEEIVELIDWVQRRNKDRPADERVGFYGLDVYSLWDSLYAVLGYLRNVEPSLLPAAWAALRCFEPYGKDVQEYAHATRFVPDACEDEVIALLRDLRAKPPVFEGEDGEAHFVAEQNALVLKNAEAYYRAMVRGGPESWNIRDRHMAETLERLMRHYGPRAKAIVWEHNTHIGDARFTEMAEEGEVNVGQLIREGHAKAGVVLVGFGSYQGSVIAARRWDAPMERMAVPPAKPESWEAVLHRAGKNDKLLLFDDESRTPAMLEPRGHRAIGVVYRPEFERYGNYVATVLPRRYDAFLYLGRTSALHPLHVVEAGHEGEVPETFPTGI